ncbi:FAD-dependent oxidoreductase [soil metagenome]
MRTDTANNLDAVIIGGSYAGLSAALQLARARRRILVVDAGLRRNRFVQSAHGFLGQDGRAPDAIAADGRAQLLAYPTARWHAGLAAQASARDGGFAVTLDTGDVVHAKRLVLALGVVDELPAIDGLAERWGRTVFHCPYCHGYELNEGRIGVIASGALSMHHALMLPDWGRVTLFTHGTFVPDADQRAALSARGVMVEPAVVARIADAATVVLADGRQLPMDGLFTATRTRVASPLAAQLGCAFDDGPLGSSIRVDEMKQTTVPGVFACGDAARMGGNVALAVGDGTLAGVGAHRSTIFDH